jgi:hypothetical protein
MKTDIIKESLRAKRNKSYDAYGVKYSGRKIPVEVKVKREVIEKN